MTDFNPNIINSVPWEEEPTGEHPTAELPQLIESAPGLPVPEAQPDTRRVVSIAEADFKGDPSRVIGHPSNPGTLKLGKIAQTAATIPSDWSEATVTRANAITPSPTVEDINGTKQ